jgi:hypothetical protein
MAELIDTSTTSFYAQLEDSITGAKSTNDGSTSGNASISPALMVGYRNDTAPSPADASECALQVDGRGRLLVMPPKGIVVTINPTLDTSAYALGDVFFVQNTIANASIENTGYGVIESVVVVDKDDVAPAFTIVFFDASVTVQTVNTAWAVSDSDMANAIGMMSFVTADYKDFGSNRMAQQNIYLPYNCASGTSIYCAAYADAASTMTASGLTIRIGLSRGS